MTKTNKESERAGFLGDQYGRKEFTARPVNSAPLTGDVPEGGRMKDADGREIIILEPKTGLVNVKEFGAQGNGVADDTAPIKEALTAGKEGTVLIPPGTFKVKPNELVVPAATAFVGVNNRASILMCSGEGDLLRMGESDIEVGKLFLKCEAPQVATGSAIDWSHGCTGNTVVENVRVGSNFYNGLYVVGEGVSEVGAVGNVTFRDLFFEEYNTAIKKYGHAAIVLGAPTHRTVLVRLENVFMQGNTKADIPVGIEVRNTDSLQATNILVQTVEEGIVIGKGDTSVKKTSNLQFINIVTDTCTPGWNIANSNWGNFIGCHAQGCSTGIVLAEGLFGNTFEGGSVYSNESNGILVQGSVVPNYSNAIQNMQIFSNGTSKEAGMAGIRIEEKVGGLLITGNQIGNPEGLGGEQKYGIVLGKKSENIGLYGNRFMKNNTAPFNKLGEEVNINGKAAPTLAELETVNLKS